MFSCHRKVDIYVAGFPCKAFSRLRTFSLWLSDPEARPFYGVVANIKRMKPRVSWPNILCCAPSQLVVPYPSGSTWSQAGVLENVLGLATVLEEVKAYLAKELPEYDVFITILCPWLGCIITNLLALSVILWVSCKFALAQVRIWSEHGQEPLLSPSCPEGLFERGPGIDRCSNFERFGKQVRRPSWAMVGPPRVLCFVPQV